MRSRRSPDMRCERHHEQVRRHVTSVGTQPSSATGTAVIDDGEAFQQSASKLSRARARSTSALAEARELALERTQRHLEQLGGLALIAAGALERCMDQARFVIA